MLFKHSLVEDTLNQALENHIVFTCQRENVHLQGVKVFHCHTVQQTTHTQPRRDTQNVRAIIATKAKRDPPSTRRRRRRRRKEGEKEGETKEKRNRNTHHITPPHYNHSPTYPCAFRRITSFCSAAFSSFFEVRVHAFSLCVSGLMFASEILSSADCLVRF
jgi:hypothetical protein